jgi:hypothetical protein
MIRLTDNLWIGDSADEERADLAAAKIGVVLNVAQDLHGTRGWLYGIEYAQVGLIDGPGNPLAAYHAAVLALAVLLKRGRVLLCCHTGGRALAVAIMYLHLTSGRGWDSWLASLRERVDSDLPELHEAHRAAFDRMNWQLLTSAMGD